jgi:hypothetical protein
LLPLVAFFERLDTLISTHPPLPQVGGDQESREPQREPFTAPHDSFAKRSLRRFHSCPRKRRGFKIPVDRVKVNSSEQIF